MNAEPHLPREPDGRAPDVIVIGAGIIGSGIALRLAQAGLRVAVFDRGEPGGEASSAAAGMIAPQGEQLEPEAFSDLCWASHGLYPQFVAEIEELSGADVGYRRDGSLLVALDDEQTRELEEIAEAQAHRGLEVDRLTLESARERVPGLADGVREALFLPGDHWVDNERLTAAVIEAAVRLGVVFHSGTAVSRFEVRNHRVQSIEANGTSFSAGEFVLAAGCWSGALAASAGIELPTEPCRGQMLEFVGEDLPLVVRAGHHYAVPRPDHRVLVGTTAEYAGFEKSVTAEGLASVLGGVLRVAPFLKQCQLRRVWAGLRPDTADHLPILGRSVLDNLTVATGHFRNGILLAPVTARLIADMMLTSSSPTALEPFRADRFAFEARAGRR